MQNAGQQYCQGGSTSLQNQAANFGQTEPSNTNNGGSTTSSLRQFRRKVEDKHQSQDNNQRQIPESHVARVAPQNHYPPRTSECYRYPNQYQDYSYNVPSQVKYSEISEPPQSVHQEHISPGSVIQKAKPTKDYMEICNPQPVVKQPYNDLHMNNQQQAYNDGTMLPQAPYIPKDPQVHPLYKPESQYFPKEPQYPAQLQHQMQKYNMPPAQMRKYPSSDNEFLSKLQQINPMVARSIMSDHHLQEPQKTYQNLDQNRMYPMHHNQRYMNHPSTMQGNHYPHAGFMPHQPYPNYPSSCTFARSPQMTQPRFPSISPHERSISPRRTFSDGMTMSMSYPGIHQKISPNYPQYNAPDFAQHYQQRRPSISQDYYQQHCRPAQYLPHQMQAQEIPESRVTVSDSIKQYIENWADEETASEMNQTEANRYNKDGLRAREDQLSETVYTINASELQYLEPLVESENGIPLVTSVSIDNTPAMIRIVDKSGQVDFSDHNGERIVNVHIMEQSNKSDCMLASNKSNELNQRLQETPFNNGDKSRIVIQQNTVIQSSCSQSLNLTKEQDHTGNATQQTKVGTSLPIITDEQDTIEEVKKTVIEECKKEVVDKNCSPINMEAIEALKDDRDYPSDPVPNIADAQKPVENDIFELNLTNIPNIETYTGEPINEKPKESSENDSTINEVKNEQDSANEHDSREKESESSPKLKESDQSLEKEPVSVEETKQPVEEIVENRDIGVVKDIEKKHNIKKTTNKTDKNSNKKEIKEGTQQSKEKYSKRSKRIFSVDDIINNIGHNVKKSRKETERRHSLHSVMEFLDKELKNTFIFDAKRKGNDTENKSVENTKNTQEEIELETKQINKNVTESTDTVTTKEVDKDQKLDEINEETNEDHKTDSSQPPDKNLAKKPSHDEALQSSQDLQFRNIIKVEDSNVLLHIAGELVEINVTNVNGKKVITVTPMSSSTMVDFNDNYETLDSNEIPELLKLDEPEITNEETHVLEIESAVPEVDCVEPSSEVIIGMDLSLEEEIKLDVAQTQVICTKAAKKAYDNDLQIPSITTSDDVNNKSDNYTSNDKVSSTKEKGSKDSSEESEDLKTSKSDRDKLREFRKNRQHSKEENLVEDDEEFVPFKDLIKARKIKKMKMLEMKKNEEIVKADSTNKEDEVIKENNSVTDKKLNKTKDKKEVLVAKSSQDETKKHKTSSSKNKSSRDKNEKRHKDKHRSSDKSIKKKNRSEKKNTVVQKVSSEQDLAIGKETTKKESSVLHSPKKSDKESSVLQSPRKLDKESSVLQLPKQSDKEDSKINEIKEENTCPEAMELKENLEVVAESTEKVQVVITEVNSKEKITELVKTQVEQSNTLEKITETRTLPAGQSKPSKEQENGERKKKLSLQEYNNRKRKLIDKSVIPAKKIHFSDSLQSLSEARSQRPKSLDDLECLKDPKPSCSQVKRKYSLGSLAAPNHFDWDETQSPKRNFDIQEKRFSEFRGLISDKSNTKPVIKQIEDKSLQNYKEKVQSKLSSLNIQIPKSKIVNIEDGSIKNETSELMQKFLQHDKLTATEMEKIKKIISYKRLFQQLDKVNPQIASKHIKNEVINDSLRVDKDTKLNLKKQTTVIKKKKKRFRNLYGSVSSSESENETLETKNSTSGDYSVVQSNCLAGVVPKLIIKRRPEMPLPFVKLERLDLDVLYHEKRVCTE